MGRLDRATGTYKISKYKEEFIESEKNYEWLESFLKVRGGRG